MNFKVQVSSAKFDMEAFNQRNKLHGPSLIKQNKM